MDLQDAKNEYEQAMKKGQKEYRERVLAGLLPNPAVLDQLIVQKLFLADAKKTMMEYDPQFMHIIKHPALYRF